MIAVDTNILVHAHREDAQWHNMAHGRVTELAEKRTSWAIPWPCRHEFLTIVTDPRIYAAPPVVGCHDRPGQCLAGGVIPKRWRWTEIRR